MFKRYLLLLITFLFSASLSAADADAIVGVWKTATTENGYSHVEIYQENGKYHGKIIFLSEPNYTELDVKKFRGKVKVGEVRRDQANPDKGKRNDPILGLKIVSNFMQVGNQWRQGRVYDPESGKTYKGKIWLNKNGTLSLRGFVGISAFGRSTVWTPVAEDEVKHSPLEKPMTDVITEEAVEVESTPETIEEAR